MKFSSKKKKLAIAIFIILLLAGLFLAGYVITKEKAVEKLTSPFERQSADDPFSRPKIIEQ